MILTPVEDRELMLSLKLGEDCAFGYLAQDGPAPLAAAGFSVREQTVVLEQVRFFGQPDAPLLDGLLRAAFAYAQQHGNTHYLIPAVRRFCGGVDLEGMGYETGEKAAIQRFFEQVKNCKGRVKK